MNRSFVYFLALCCLAVTIAVNGFDQKNVVSGQKDLAPNLDDEGLRKTLPPIDGATKNPPLENDRSETLTADVSRDSDDETVLSRLDLAKLSETRADLARFGHTQVLSVETKCKTYADLLLQMLGARAASDERDLFSQVVRVLSRRKLPFGNSQPVLTDLQECLNSSPLEAEPLDPKREVIASPTERKRKEEPSSAEKGMKKAIGEFNDVKNNVKDYGQDIYLPDKNGLSKGIDSAPVTNPKPQGVKPHPSSKINQDIANEHMNQPEEHHEDLHQYTGDYPEDSHPAGEEYSSDSFANEVHPESTSVADGVSSGGDQRGGVYSYAHSSAVTNSNGKTEVAYEVSSTDPQGNNSRLARKYRKELEDNSSIQSSEGRDEPDIGSMEALIDDCHQEIFDLRNRVAELEWISEKATTEAAQAKEALQSAAPNQGDPSIDRARAETYRLQYEAVAQREVDLLKQLNEYRAKAEGRESNVIDSLASVDNDSDDEYESSSGATNLVEVAGKLAHKLDFSEDPVKRCIRYYLLFSFPKKIDKNLIKTVARLRVPSIQVRDADYKNTLLHVANNLLKSSKKKAILVGSDIQQCLAQTSHSDSTKIGINNNYSYSSVRQSVPVYKAPLPPIPPLPQFPHFPPMQVPDSRSYWGPH